MRAAGVLRALGRGLVGLGEASTSRVTAQVRPGRRDVAGSRAQHPAVHLGQARSQ
jgi:hypothetical protein